MDWKIRYRVLELDSYDDEDHDDPDLKDAACVAGGGTEEGAGGLGNSGVYISVDGSCSRLGSSTGNNSRLKTYNNGNTYEN